jgi:hypothetical protein
MQVYSFADPNLRTRDAMFQVNKDTVGLITEKVAFTKVYMIVG